MRIGQLTEVYKPHINGVANFVSLHKRALESLGHEAFAAQMWRLASDAGLRRQLAVGARKTGTQYDIRYISSALISHYEQLVEERVAVGTPS